MVQPLSVLVVEDQTEKFNAVAAVVRKEANGGSEIDRAPDLSSAREKLRNKRYDLLILDIAVPALSEGDALPDGGVQLLEELERGRHLRMPTHIVGLTAYEEVYNHVASRFASRCVTLVRYESASVEWQSALAARVWFTLRAKDAVADASYGTDLAIVCALQVPELRAVRSNGWDWKPDHQAGDPTIYYRTVFYTPEGEKTAVAGAACQMGMTATAVLAMKMILTYRPRYIAMAGITAAREGEANIGDVLVANPTWDWGSGKLVDEDLAGITEHQIAPSQLRLNAFVRERLQYLSSRGQVLDAIRASWNSPPSTILRLHIGPVASGASVIADSLTMDHIQRQHRKLLGVEMEGYAVHVAAEEAPSPQPIPFVMKSVSDFGKPPKIDTAQTYAAFTSAHVLRVFAEQYLWGDPTNTHVP